MGLAISSMHYTAMMGVQLVASEHIKEIQSNISADVMAGFVTLLALLIQTGIIIAALLDESYSNAKNTVTDMKHRADINLTLSNILTTAIEHHSLPVTLEKVLGKILAIDWLSFQQQGSIFLADENEKTLSMVAHHNLPPELLNTCSKLQYGECLCGKAAEKRETIFRSCIDQDHLHHFENMIEHGHYCVPIQHGETLLGVLNLYLQPDHLPTSEETQFLTTAADAIAVIILSRRIEQHNHMISAAIDQAGDVVMITDNHGNIQYVNRAFSKITGYSENEAIGQQPSILKSGNQTTEFYREMWTTILSDKVWQGEVVERRKDGSYYPAMLTISPIRIGSTSITHFVATHEDLSEHKKLEEQFRQSQKMEALGTLVGGIAHEFNNMLAGMMGNLFLAKRKSMHQPDVTQKLERMEKVGFQAAEMIKEMLIFARSETVEMNHLSLAPFLTEAIHLHHLAIPENIHFEKHLCNDDLCIQANPTQLQQVILNLFTNASDAVSQISAPTISITLEKLSKVPKSMPEKCPACAHICVVDNGHGIAKEQLEHIFDPFYTTKEPGKGTGLGLAMCASIIQAHHGILNAESSLGSGTTFHIYLPLTVKKECSEQREYNTTVMQANGEKILIVDDEPNLSIATAEALKDIGFEVMTAANGLLAVEMCDNMKPDVVILDVVMPVMDGPEAARIIKQRYPDISLIFASGYDRGQLNNETKGLESIPLLSKPFSISTLCQAIMQLLEKQQKHSP